MRARAEQRRLAARVRLGPSRSLPPAVVGVDVSYGIDDDVAVAVAVALDTATFAVVDQSTAVGAPEVPYVPGLLSFRELPLVLAALRDLDTSPQLIVVDGHGYAHPARFGLACHLGVELGVATIGCAKTPFVGTFDEPGPERGAWADIVVEDGEVVGSALRTRIGVKPVFVSPGHLIDGSSARAIVLALSPRYRLPETTRQADQLSRRALAALTDD